MYPMSVTDIGTEIAHHPHSTSFALSLRSKQTNLRDHAHVGHIHHYVLHFVQMLACSSYDIVTENFSRTCTYPSPLELPRLQRSNEFRVVSSRAQIYQPLTSRVLGLLILISVPEILANYSAL